MVVSLTASVVLLGVLARYLRRRKTPKPVRRTRKFVGRRSRNSVRSPNGLPYLFLLTLIESLFYALHFSKTSIKTFNKKCIFIDLISLSGSRASARSQSPGGSTVALSDRLSLASGSLGAGIIQGTPLSPQQLGVMGMEALETVINFWEDALTAYTTPTQRPEDSEFCQEIQALLDLAWSLQDKSELLFLDQRSVLFRNNESSAHSSRQLSRNDRSGSDPNFDSAESFASALDQVADLRDFEEFTGASAEMQHFELYQSAVKHLEEQPIPFRTMRTEQVNCGNDVEYLAKLHCIRLAFQYLFKVCGRNIDHVNILNVHFFTTPTTGSQHWSMGGRYRTSNSYRHPVAWR